MIRFFLTRPIFAAVCSAVILTAGIVSIPTLPVAQFPQVAPPTISITATYPGANAQEVESAVTTPIEEAVNGSQGLRYISSVSGDDGTTTITCTFDLSRDIDKAAADVLVAVQQANGQLPASVKMTGVTVRKVLGSLLLSLSLYADPGSKYDTIFLSNYASLQVIDPLKRISGVGDVTIFGDRTYAMRLWLDPKKLADNGLTSTDVVNALTAQNVQVPAGALGQEPTPKDQPYYLSLTPNGQLTTANQFDQLILKTTPNGGSIHLRDVGRAELGAQQYANISTRNGQTNIGLGIQQSPGSNALQTSQLIQDQMAKLATRFPPGVHWGMNYDTTDFVRESIREVIETLLFSILLVVLVIYVFLQDWRTTLIPAITIPVSLIGTFGLMNALGFSINTLTLFGLTLATGLVVDDAIVVIENIARYMQDRDRKGDNVERADGAMREITGAVVATSLVLLAVFVPVGFFPGTTGRLYQQFALTIACSVTISLFVALTLTPALAVLLVRQEPAKPGRFFGPINRAIDGTRSAYARLLPKITGGRRLVAIGFVLALVATGLLYKATPTAFLPDEDLGYFFVTIQAAEGTPLGKEQQISQKVDALLRKIPGLALIFDIGGRGQGSSGNGTNRGFVVVRLKPWSERKGADAQLGAILKKLQPELAAIPDAKILALNPPAVQGIGSVGGFQYELEDPTNVGLGPLSQTANELIGKANGSGTVERANTSFTNSSPHLAVDVDRAKITQAGLSLSDVFGAMQAYLGSQYVNDFTYTNRDYRVYVQADTPYRARISDLSQIFVRNAQGVVSPLSTYVTLRQVTAPPIITHYNLFRNIELTGLTPAGKGSGETIKTMEQLSQGGTFPHEWSGLSLEEIQGGSASALLFALGLLFVFFVLAAQYESLTDPLVILLATPLAIFGALAGLHLRGLSSDVYAQVGFVLLIGLAAKNAILIVEFANQLREGGMDAVEAVEHAAQTRLRPILMTSFAFILGVVPLVFASGAGAASRHSLGTVVFGGMIVSTFLNLGIVPALYLFAARFDRKAPAHPAPPSESPGGGPPAREGDPPGAPGRLPAATPTSR